LLCSHFGETRLKGPARLTTMKKRIRPIQYLLSADSRLRRLSMRRMPSRAKTANGGSRTVRSQKGRRSKKRVASRVPIVLALNKIDLIKKSALLPMIEQLQTWATFSEMIPIAAATGDGVDALEKALLAKMPDGDALFPEDFLTDQPERVLVAEIVREKVLRHTRDELPFSTAVVIDQFEEPDRPGGLMRLFCTILVETESQKPIVIGRAGSMIKRIGTEAREDIERFFSCKVFLDLRVKVRPNWRDDERTLDQLGLPHRKNRNS